MKGKIHGLISIIIIFTALFIAAVSIINISLFNGILYLVLSIPAFIIILYSYCAKCPCREGSCGHILPGFLTKFLPKRKTEKYTLPDYLGALIGLAWLILFPQFRLWKNPAYAVLFWGLVVLAVIEIRMYVCKACKNDNCPFCKKGEKS